MKKSPVAGIRDSPGASVTLSDAQIATWAKQGGFTGDEVVTAVAIALAESRGVNDAIGGPNSDGSYDFGVWQINSIHKASFAKYPDWMSVTNANQAREIFNGQGWKAWSAYNAGKHKEFLDRAKSAAGSAPEGATGQATPQNSWQVPGVNALIGIAQAISKAGTWMSNRDNWSRAGMVVVGGGLVLAGISIAAKPLALNASPVGQVLKKVGGK